MIASLNFGRRATFSARALSIGGAAAALRPAWSLVLGIAAAAALLATGARAQANDTLVLSNGDKISGQLTRGDGDHAIFKSPSLGTLTVAWKEVQELTAPRPFVVVTKDGKVQRGWIHVVGGKLEITAPSAAPGTPPQGAPGAQALPGQAAPVTVTAGDVNIVVDEATYDKVVAAHPDLDQGWAGSLNAGVALVSATQSSSSYTAGIDMHRTVPTVGWLPPRSDTHFTVQGTYGKISQPGVATIVVSIFGGGVEQDEYLNKRLFVFATAGIDHNRALGLNLQQSYGGGAGWKVKQTATTDFSLKADAHYTHQEFYSPPTVQFAASGFSEALVQKFGKLVWTETAGYVPSYTIKNAYQANALSVLALPVYHGLSVNITAADNYIGNPQPGYQHNSFQFSTGLQIAVAH